MTENTEICRINADGTTTYHWENIEAEAQKWQPGCYELSVYLSKLLLPLRPSLEWVGLTDEEIVELLDPLVMADLPDPATDYEIARAIEAKLKEKNT